MSNIGMRSRWRFEKFGLATLSGVISDKAGPIIVEWAAAIQHVGPCRAPISEPWISTSQLGFHSYRLTRASFATRVQRTRFQDRWAVFWPGNMEPPPRVA